MRAFPIALLGLVIGSGGRAQQRPRLPLDLSRLVARRDSFAVLVQGNQIGFLRSVLERGAEGFTYTETSSIGGLVDQTTTVVLDPSGAMKSVRQAGTVQGQPASIELDYGDGRVRGKASTVGADGAKSVSIDTTVAPGTVDDNLIQGILPALSLAPDQSWEVGVFIGASSEYRVTTLKVAGTDRAAIGTDTVSTFRVEWSGVAAATTFWITSEQPHRILKIALAGAPIEIVRVSK